MTILHSNDLHGDFLAEQVDEKLVGGVSRLSGYINKVRNNSPRDEALERCITQFKDYTDKKYGRVLTRFLRAYTHPGRNMETELGDLLAEGIREQLGVDLVFLGSGSIRGESLGPIVTLGDFVEIFPYNETLCSK